MSRLTQEKQLIAEQLDHSMGCADQLIAERGACAKQLSHLARTTAQERECHEGPPRVPAGRAQGAPASG